MATNKIVDNKELFSPTLFKGEVVDNAKALLVILTELDKQLISVAKSQKQILTTEDNKSTKSIQRTNEAVKKLNESEVITQKIRKQKLALEQRLKIARTSSIQDNVRLNEQLKQQTVINRQLEKETQKVFGAYTNLSTRLVRLRKEYKNLAAAEKGNTKEAKALLRQITKLDSKLKQIDKTVGQSQRNVGNYTSAFGRFGSVLRSTLGAFGLIGGVQIFTRAIRGAFDIVRNFQSESATLAGVLNTTRGNIKALTVDAQRLGSITAKTAIEVTKLQVAYARLGFSQEEILQVTEGTIAGSIALNASLEETAELTGAVIRTFDDFEAQDSGAILDVLTAATQKSALNFDKLRTALPVVAGAANAAGIPFTRLVALLGKLSDSGIDASSSATAIRNIFIESAAQGLNYEQILDKIAGSTNKLTAANDEFGKRAAVSASILAKNIKNVNDLDDALQDVAGTAQRVADEQLNTLNGRITLLTSAYEGFINSVVTGDGPISSAISNITDSIAELLGALTLLNKGVDDFGAEAEKDETNFVKSVIGSADDVNSVFTIIRSELAKAEKQLDGIQLGREDLGGLFEKAISPGSFGVDKILEVQEGILIKRIELLKKAFENPEEFLNPTEDPIEVPVVIVPSGAGNTKTEKPFDVDSFITEDDRTTLQVFKDLLGDINQERESLVAETDTKSVNAFKSLTTQGEELLLIIEVLEDKLAGINRAPSSVDAEPVLAEDLGDAYRKALDRNVKATKDASEELKTFIGEILQSLASLIDQAIQNNIQNITEQLTQVERRTDQLRDNARVGRLDADESIAFQEKKEAELQRDREKERKKQQRAQALFTVLETFNNNEQNLGKTIADVSILKTLAGSLTGFYDGTDNVAKSLGKSTLGGRDGYPIRVDGKEQIWSDKDRAKVDYRTRDEVIDIVKSFDNNNIINDGVIEINPKVFLKSSLSKDAVFLASKFSDLETAIDNIELKSDTVTVDSIRNILVHQKRSKGRVVTTKSKLH